MRKTATEEVEDHPQITLRGDLEGVWRTRTQLQRALVADISKRRWFRSKAQTIRDGELIDLVEVPGTDARIAFLKVDYVEADPETYVIPLAVATGAHAGSLSGDTPAAVVADIAGVEEQAVLYDAMRSEALPRALLSLAGSRRKLKGRRVSIYSGKIPGSSGLARKIEDVPVRWADVEQTNTSVFFDQDLIMKLFRKLEPGPNPEVEVGRFLTEKALYPNTPPARALVVASLDGRESALAFAQEFVASQGNAFDHVYDNCVLTLENVLAKKDDLGDAPRPGHPIDVTRDQLELGHTIMSSLLVDARLLGTRTAEMHLALASDARDEVFRPEPLSTLQQRSLYQAIRSAVRTSTTLLRRKRSQLRPQDAEMVDELLRSENRLLDQLKSITGTKIESDRIRIHGDYHLGQVLHTGRDFVVIDFEGEPQRPLSQRRLKRLALRDVAGMIRSYHYATLMAFHQVVEAGLDEATYLDDWAHTMHRWLSASFLEGYMETTDGSPVVPSDPGQFRLVLDALLVEKAAYELEYELNNRPDWVEIPLRGILETIE